MFEKIANYFKKAARSRNLSKTKPEDSLYKSLPAFKCHHCGSDYHLIDVVKQFGIIFLFRKKDGCFGSVCPLCEKTSLWKNEIGNILKIKNILSTITIAENYNTNCKLVYNSFPYSYHADLDMYNYISGNCFKPINGNTGRLSEKEAHKYVLTREKLKNAYCSYLFDDLAMGPYISVRWHKAEDIKTLLDVENRHNTAVFSRYVYYDTTKLTLQRLLWNHFHGSVFYYNEASAAKIFESQRYQESHFFLGLYSILNNFPSFYASNGKQERPTQYSLNNLRKLMNNIDSKNLGNLIQSVIYEKYYPELCRTMCGKRDINNAIDDLSKNMSIQLLQLSKSYRYLNSEHRKPKNALKLKAQNGNLQFVMISQNANGNSDNQGKHTNDANLPICLSTKHGLVQYLRLHIDCIMPHQVDYCMLKAPKTVKERLFESIKSTISMLERSQLDPNDIVRDKAELIEKTYSLFQNIITANKDMQELKYKFAEIAQFNTDVLILGETGTGKELFAKAIHQASEREGTFVPLNCSAIPENLFETELFGHRKGAFSGAHTDKKGAFEYADKGTLFLDEIGEMPLELQAKILRAVEYRTFNRVGDMKPITVDVKIVFATNRDLKQEVQAGRFRKDLFFRIFSPSFQILPLRERIEDIPPLVDHFLTYFNTKFDKKIKSVSSQLITSFKHYAWDGNVRELMKVIEMGVINSSGTTITKNEIPYLDDVSFSKDTATKDPDIPPATKVTDDEIKFWMEKLNNNKSQVARRLGVSYRTVLRRMKKLYQR